MKEKRQWKKKSFFIKRVHVFNKDGSFIQTYKEKLNSVNVSN
jgi:hypothetical protein